MKNHECFEKYFMIIIDSNSIAVIITIKINTQLSVNGSLKKKDKTNLESPVKVKLSVKNILNPSSILDAAA